MDQRKLKIVCKYLFKLFISAIVSLLILSAICFFYYNIPVHYTNDEGYTDYVWETNKFTSRATEGFSVGKTNNEGLNNLYDYNNQDVDILFIGSSQFEAFNVLPSENMTAQLNSKLNGECFAYSIGVSGHDFLRCTQNLDQALKKYRPSQYVILEVSDLFLKHEDINNALNNNISELNSTENKIMLALEKIPLLRHCYNQLDNALNSGDGDDDEATEQEKSYEDISSSLNLLLQKISQSAERYDVQIVFLYHNSDIDEDEQMKQQKELWMDLSQKNNIKFIDMTSDFSNAFDSNEYVYGFINTLPNTGHLNKNGHAIIADRIYKYITTGE